MLGVKACWVVVLAGMLVSAAAGVEVPGVVMAYVPASSGVYVGSPGLAACADGSYVAKYDDCGARSSEWTKGVTRVLRSADRGASWEPVAVVEGMYWATLFAHDEALYLIGTDRHDGAVVISRSRDGGRTWTQPKDASSGLLKTMAITTVRRSRYWCIADGCGGRWRTSRATGRGRGIFARL